MEDRKWEDLEMDCLLNVFGRLSLEDMVLGVPFVCRSWYKASTNPLCWQVLNFIPLCHLEWDASLFEERFMREYRVQKYSFTGLLKFVVTRSRGSAVVAELVGKLKHLEILLLEVIPDSFTEILQVISNHCKNFVNLKASGWVDDNVASARI
ncbi:F-box protein FBW2-like [Tasmannia lanceolata]|uniref:F-box protein FBW2-like n=1 Tax=Tasmannia lanceolata TaxID=3420 RepID=UPI004063DEA6